MPDDMLGRTVVKMVVDLPAEMVGTLRDLCEKLGGKEGGEWFVALKRFLRKEDPWSGGRCVFSRS